MIAPDATPISGNSMPNDHGGWLNHELLSVHRPSQLDLHDADPDPAHNPVLGAIAEACHRGENGDQTTLANDGSQFILDAGTNPGIPCSDSWPSSSSSSGFPSSFRSSADTPCSI